MEVVLELVWSLVYYLAGGVVGVVLELNRPVRDIVGEVCCIVRCIW